MNQHKLLAKTNILANDWEKEFTVRFQATFEEKLSPAPENVAILVTSEYEGIFKNGGIGTYYKTLSEKLSSQGLYIILILCQTEKEFQGESSVAPVQHIFSTHEAEKVLQLQGIHQGILSEFQQWEWVESESYRILFFVQAIAAHFRQSPIYVEFPDLCGLGYRTIQAKRAGLLGQHCVTAVTLHSGQEWLNEAHEKYSLYPGWNWFKNVYGYEQYCCEKADLAFFLSWFMAEKVKSYGWNMTHAIHLPYCFPIVPALDKKRPMLDRVGLNLKRQQIPIVFFGRLEERKGLLTFLEAIAHITQQFAYEEISQQLYLLFLGKTVSLHAPETEQQDSQHYIERKLNNKFNYTIISDLFSQEAISLVQELAPAIVCLTSPQENFPNSALEMGQLPVSLVVSDTGGFRETLNLIGRSDKVRWFEPGNSQSLAAEIANAIEVYPEIPVVAKPEFLAAVNQSLLNQRLEYMKQAFTQGTVTKQQLSSPESYSRLLGMTSDQEQIFLQDYGQNIYSGQGEIIDLGCWLGSATISLAKGVEINRRVALKYKRIHAYDLFTWHPYMEQTVKGTSWEGQYQPGDSFLDEFTRRISPWSPSIKVYPGDVTEIGWNGGAIEYLFVDAMKSWELTKNIFLNFYCDLIPGVSLVHYNDFAHYATAWIHLLIDKLRPHFKHHCNLYQAAVFQYVKPLPNDTLILKLDPPFSIFSTEDVHQAFAYSLQICHDKLRPNIAAAKVMAFIYLGDIDQAKQELIKAREMFGDVGEIPLAAEEISRRTM
ncbi:glycosyltransferase family 4 protein [Laspinema olomoucense]|uniref:Glycosyltransferase family 4 protein n=1 Tax=Laspinema olomoucense D3b TaxID=2953688 RepID=A0ABT2NDA2_9CYAN|nr:glycosyltransferase family 4 protein [Laspinema sp. D3b]MCT7979859.1 glycosyltransferase family 4 protein [Laspinema sp. D3b]